MNEFIVEHLPFVFFLVIALWLFNQFRGLGE